MKLKKIYAAIAVSLLISASSTLSASATAGKEPLQAYFSDDGHQITIFTSEHLEDNSSLLVGNTMLEAEVKNSDINVHTVFLVDNSTSMPYNLRDEVKAAITDYVAYMPSNESVKIALFDTQTTILADEYSNDKEFIGYEISKIDFKGQASLVYDAVMNVINSESSTDDIYSRTILITDGVDSVEGTSYDYLRNEISENGRYHVDVVQVSTGDKQDVNLAAISNLGSNTYTLFNGGVKFDALIPRNVSMLKANLTNDVTTGELKGVTIKSGASNISLGSIMFPQVEIAPPATEPEPEESTTEATDTTSAVLTTTEPATNDDKESFPWMTFLYIIAGAAVIGGSVAAFLIIKKKKTRVCTVAVHIAKEEHADQNGVGPDVWAFPVNSEFRVGRILEPKADDNSSLPKNDRAICENATNEDISSIGRNAFALSYDEKMNMLVIRNTAKGATFSIETGERHQNVTSASPATLMRGSKILLGNYTTITIQNITVNNR